MYEHISEVAVDIDRESYSYAIGNLQGIRKRLKGSGCQAGSHIFQFHRQSQSIQEGNYAYHWGGRRELQFNVRIHHKADGNYIEYGLAFSLVNVRGQSIVEELRPRIQRFNDFIRICNGDFSGYYVSVYKPNKSCEIRPPRDLYIPEEWIEQDNFIKFFKMLKVTADLEGVHVILSDFDNLLPLYEYTMASI